MADKLNKELWDIIISELVTVDRIKLWFTCKHLYQFRENELMTKVKILEDILKLGNEAGLLVLNSCPQWHQDSTIKSIIKKVINTTKNNQKFKFTVPNVNSFRRFVIYNIFRPLRFDVEKHVTPNLRISAAVWCSDCRCLYKEEDHVVDIIVSRFYNHRHYQKGNQYYS